MKPATTMKPHSVKRRRHLSARATLSGPLVCALMIALAGTPAPAQTRQSTPVALIAPAEIPLLGQTERARIEAALGAMSAQDLHLTFARIHAAFRAHIGDDDLRLARALIDCAFLTEAELARRGFAPPDGTESAGEMLRLYELVL